MSYLDLFLRLILGVQLTFWGLNGFFHWKPIPPSSPVIDRFVGACYETRFIMPMVKILEIVLGLFLVFNFSVPLALAILSPVIFVVSGLHLLHNKKKSWEVLLPISLPFLILTGLYYETWLHLI